MRVTAAGRWWAEVGAKAAFLALLAAAIALPAFAASFSVTPVRIYMRPQDRAVAVTIANESDGPVVLQADIYSWTQTADGTDELALTEDLVLSPPIIKLGRKARQVVRLARLKPPDASRQLTYRLIMREVPEAMVPKDNIQVTIALALSMPVFITPAPARRKVACDASRGEQSTLNVGCANVGSAYAQVREVLVKDGERVLGRFEGGAYILPGARKVLPIKAENIAPGARLQIVVNYDDGRSESFDVTVGS
ncbi:MAG TPA: fimbria/pilus periplasmic chaperone [Burkholderiales bacterium]|nr:fimbria/pilus periplasmic chaperone [Burkholderiales bacterium]